MNSPEENDCGNINMINGTNLSERVSNELKKASSDGCLEEKPGSDKELDKQLSISEGNLSKETKIARLKVELKSGTVSGVDAHRYLLEVPESPVYDEPEFNINKAELRKSSSLKCNKTPPGTPREKENGAVCGCHGSGLRICAPCNEPGTTPQNSSVCNG